MSFYDDASLVFLPSGGAGKDGKAYSMKPVPEYGSELVTNGDFATDSDWTFTNVGGSNGWRIADGRAICDTINPSSGRNLNSSTSLVSGKSYKVTLDILQSADELGILVGSTLIQNAFSIGTTIGASYIIDSSQHSGGTFSFYGGSSDLQEIDNVSVREVVVADGDFTFSRGSNLTATRIDSNGLIEKGRENLLLQSNQFDTTWVTSNTSVASGQSGYDGSNNAWLLENVSGVSAYVLQNKVVNGVQTASVYAKSGNVDYIYLRLGGSSSRGLYANLSNGTIYSTFGTLIDYSVDSVGNDWYRVSVTYEGNHSNFRIYPSASGSTSTSLGDNIYIQDAQLEQGLVATEYIESGATTGLAGILEDSPRFDYSGGASCPSLLLEPSRTNIVPISEGIPEDTIQVTLTKNYGTSPEGVQNSLKVQKNGVSSSDRIFPIDNYNATLVSGTSYSVSAFVKNIDVNGTTTIACRLGSGGTLFRLGYEWSGSSLAISSGYAAGTRTNEILEDYGNGWWRIGFSFEADNTQGGIELDIDRDNGSATTSIETYGWQLEEGSYPTSYIPNHSGGSVSRESDVYQNTNIDTVTNMSTNECTVLLDVDLPQGREGSSRFLQFTDIAGGGSTYFGLKGNYVPSPIIQLSGGGTINQSSTHNLSVGRHKIAIRWLSGTATVYIDGAEVSALSVTDSAAPTSFDKVFGSGAPYRHLVHRLVIFPSALSDANCVTLTS